jgi:hypothetical protein
MPRKIADTVRVSLMRQYGEGIKLKGAISKSGSGMSGGSGVHLARSLCSHSKSEVQLSDLSNAPSWTLRLYCPLRTFEPTLTTCAL